MITDDYKPPDAAELKRWLELLPQPAAIDEPATPAPPAPSAQLAPWNFYLPARPNRAATGDPAWLDLLGVPSQDTPLEQAWTIKRRL